MKCELGSYVLLEDCKHVEKRNENNCVKQHWKGFSLILSGYCSWNWKQLLYRNKEIYLTGCDARNDHWVDDRETACERKESKAITPRVSRSEDSGDGGWSEKSFVTLMARDRKYKAFNCLYSIFGSYWNIKGLQLERKRVCSTYKMLICSAISRNVWAACMHEENEM